MKINAFFTEVAKDHAPEVECVAVSELKEHWGEVRSAEVRNKFVIFLDPRAMECIHRAFFVLFHEIGHIRAGHADAQCSINEDEKEFESDRFAFMKMDICFTCWLCITSRSEWTTCKRR